MLRLSTVSIVLDGKDIYPLGNDQKLVIDIDHNNPVLVVTDGFHISRPLELVYHHLHTYYFRVECGVDDVQLACGFTISAMLLFLGFVTHWLVFPIVSSIPVIYVVAMYFLNRKDFLSLRAT